MALELKAEDEQIIARGVDARVISSAADVLQLGVEVVRQGLNERATTSEDSDRRGWSLSLRGWIDSHEKGAPLLSDKASKEPNCFSYLLLFKRAAGPRGCTN